MSRGSLETARWAIVCAAILVLTASAQARDVDDPWWADMPRLPSSTRQVEAPRWYDAIDVAAGVTGDTRRGSIAGDLSLRVRLDAPAYLMRVDQERTDLAAMDEALLRQQAMHEQLDWFARRCEGLWRAWQVRLIDASLERAPPEMALEVSYREALRRILVLDATQPARPSDVGACRLAGVIDGLALAHDHPTLMLDAASRSIRERTERVMAAPAPATGWLALDLEVGSFGQRADIRLGLDVPVAVRAGALDLHLVGDAGGARGRVAWQRSGVEANAGSHHRLTTAASSGDTRERLADVLHRRRLEAQLLWSDAERMWWASCGSVAPTDVLACITTVADPTLVNLGPDATDTVLAAIDAEIRALRGVLGVIEAAGHLLEVVVSDR